MQSIELQEDEKTAVDPGKLWAAHEILTHQEVDAVDLLRASLLAVQREVVRGLADLADGEIPFETDGGHALSSRTAAVVRYAEGLKTRRRISTLLADVGLGPQKRTRP